jgi:integrase
MARPKGAKTKHRYRGVFKQCDCAKWTKCRHPWHMTFRSVHRCQLNKAADRLGVPRPTSPSEALRVRSKVIDRILDGTWDTPKAAVAPLDTRLTAHDLTTPYLKDFANTPWRGKPRRPHRVERLKKQLALICRTPIPITKGATLPFGEKVFADIITPDIEAWREAHRAHMRQQEQAAGEAKARKLPVSVERPRAADGNVGLNRHLEVIRQWFSWAIKKGHYLRESPFRLHGESIIDFTDEAGRSRRLLPGEEEKLLAACKRIYNAKGKLIGGVPHLYDLIIAALESGCRSGELLALTWADVKQDAKGRWYLDLRAETTKTNEPRKIPVSPRLVTVLAMRRHAPDGTEHEPDKFVFGNDVGEQFNTIKTSWTSACKNAGIDDLHFHDLRREAGSRWLEGGINLNTVSKMLGHANVSTSDRYLKPSQAINEREMRAYHERQISTKATPPRKTAKKTRPEARVH